MASKVKTTEKEPAEKEGARLFSVNEIAEQFRVTPRAVRGWITDGCPVAVKGSGRGSPHQLELAAVREWRSDSGSPGAKLDSARERALLDKARRVNQDMRNKLLAGELLPKADVELMLSALVMNARAKLLTLRVKLPPVVMGCMGVEEIEQATGDIVNEALEELAQFDYSDIAALEAAAESDSEPVGGHLPEAEPGGERGTGELANQSS